MKGYMLRSLVKKLVVSAILVSTFTLSACCSYCIRPTPDDRDLLHPSFPGNGYWVHGGRDGISLASNGKVTPNLIRETLR